jgi:hypothetical protein
VWTKKDSINGAWQPNDVQYIDYSGQGYAKTVAENFDMPKVGNISSMFDAVINHYFKDGAPSVEKWYEFKCASCFTIANFT